MNNQNLAREITALHQQSILEWKQNDIVLKYTDFLKLVEENHAFNYQLWHTEDRARRDDLGFEVIYHAKRTIDKLNQQRNNRMEMIDEWLFNHLTPAPPSLCPVHSETPGMIIDRLSILALKTYHMGLQAQRTTVDNAHREQCQQKTMTLDAQKCQLQSCLQDFLDEIQHKTRTFKPYHQFKMYNDPNLNPELYLQNS